MPLKTSSPPSCVSFCSFCVATSTTCRLLPRTNATHLPSGLNEGSSSDSGPLVRRTGLPPSIDEIDAFVGDAAPDAYERVVDRLLASPRYGERMAVPWLDAARYADTSGYQSDGERYMYVPGLGVFRATASASGDLTVTEGRLRSVLSRVMGGPTAAMGHALRDALDDLLGTAWDTDLEPYRHAGEGAPVVRLTQVS